MDKIFLVLDGDCDGDWPIAAYFSQEMAKEHAEELGYRVVEVEIRVTLPEEVTDPLQKKKRATLCYRPLIT